MGGAGGLGCLLVQALFTRGLDAAHFATTRPYLLPPNYITLMTPPRHAPPWFAFPLGVGIIGSAAWVMAAVAIIARNGPGHVKSRLFRPLTVGAIAGAILTCFAANFSLVLLWHLVVGDWGLKLDVGSPLIGRFRTLLNMEFLVPWLVVLGTAAGGFLGYSRIRLLRFMG